MSDGRAWAAEQDAREDALRTLGRCVTCEKKSCKHLKKEARDRKVETLNGLKKELEQIKRRVPVLENLIELHEEDLRKK